MLGTGYRAAYAACIIFFIFLCSCGEIDSIFSSNRSYEVSALAEKTSLDESALIKQYDEIRPFFVHSIHGDTDVQGLRVFVQNTNRQQVGEEVIYHTRAIEKDYAYFEQPEEEYVEPPEVDLEEDYANPPEDDPEDEFAEPPEDDLEEDYAEPPEEDPDDEYANLPEEDLNDEYAEPPEEDPIDEPEIDSEDHLITDPPRNSPNVRLIPIEYVDNNFPAFSLPESLEPGAYIMVFQVLGYDKKIINTTEKKFYYMAGKDYQLTEIKVSLPGYSPTPHLVQPETTVLLEAKIEADEGLDPYIVWYNGKSCIYEGKVGDGAGRFLWKIPGNTSFINLRAEVVPFPPIRSGNEIPEKLLGRTKTISFAVSGKAQIMEMLAHLVEARKLENTGIKINYYKFEGDLLDDFNPANEQAIQRVKTGKSVGNNALWLSSGYAYGLATGPNDRYMIPAFKIRGEKKFRHSFQAAMSFKPLVPGVVFAVLFSEKRLELVWEGEGLSIYLFTKDKNKQLLASVTDAERDEEPAENLTDKVEEAVVQQTIDANSFITLSVLFTISGNELIITLGDDEIIVEHNFDDEGSIQIGGDTYVPPTEEDSEDAILVDPSLPVMILDELVLIRYPGIPIEEVSLPLTEDNTEITLPL